MYNQTMKSLNNSQTIILDFDPTNLQFDNVLIDLKETIDIPTNGTNIIKVQRAYVDIKFDIDPDIDPTLIPHPKALFIYLNDLPLKGHVYHTNLNCHNLIGVVPIKDNQPFWYENSTDTSIANEIIDGRTFKSFSLKITDEKGQAITFKTSPIIQLNIEKIAGGQPDTPRLLIQQAYNK